jgi:GNAT superfamily N-acetyltransferase
MAEDLETGWSATTPPGDTIESDFLRAWAERIADFARAGNVPLVDDDTLTVPVFSTRTFWGNLGVVRRPDRTAADIAGRLRASLPAGAPIALVSPWSGVDLSAAGLVDDGHPPLMIRPPGPPSEPMGIPAGVQLAEVTDDDALAEWERTLIQAYPTPGAEIEPPLTLFPSGILGGRTRFWTAFRDGHPVGVAAGHAGHGVVEIEFVATMESERGRGVGRALTWAATEMDLTVPAVLVASDPGRSVYESLGYLTTRRWTFWVGAVPG